VFKALKGEDYWDICPGGQGDRSHFFIRRLKEAGDFFNFVKFSKDSGGIVGDFSNHRSKVYFEDFI